MQQMLMDTVAFYLLRAMTRLGLRVTIFSCLCVMATSCYVAMPDCEKRENILPAPDLTGSIQSSLQTPYFTIDGWPQEEWWKIFESPPLNALVALALQQNPSLQEVEARLRAAYAETTIAKSVLLPWVSLDITDGKELLSHHGLYKAFNPSLPISANLTDILITLQLDCDFWGKNRNHFYASLGEAKAREAEVAAIRLLITTALVEAYVAWKADLLRQAVLEQLLTVSRQILTLQSLMQDKALYSRLVVLSGEEEMFIAEQQLVAIQADIANDKHALNLLLGRGPDDLLPDDALLPALPEKIAIPCDLSTDLLARRPDLMVQLWRVEAQSYRVGAAIADFYPDVSFSLMLGFESVAFRNLFSWQSKTTDFAPALHLPIFTAGAIGANVQVNKATFDEAVFAYNQLVLTSAQEVADDLVAIQSLFRQSDEQKGIVTAAKKRYELTQLLKNSGLSNLFDLYAVEIEVLRTELQDIALTYQKYVSTVQLIKALGGGWNHG